LYYPQVQQENNFESGIIRGSKITSVVVMAMRYQDFIKNKYYLVSGRGSAKQDIFIDDYDYIRFIFLITHFQSPIRIYNSGWYTSGFFKRQAFSTGEKRLKSIVDNRSIELIAFTLMPESYDIIVKNLSESILSVYMHRILTAYGKYFNSKYKKRGHIFEGPFDAVPINNNSELADLSNLIHTKPKHIEGWADNLHKYPWSSYQDYIGNNRWGNLISNEIVLNQFKNQADYKKFVSSDNTGI